MLDRRQGAGRGVEQPGQQVGARGARPVGGLVGVLGSDRGVPGVGVESRRAAEARPEAHPLAVGVGVRVAQAGRRAVRDELAVEFRRGRLGHQRLGRRRGQRVKVALVAGDQLVEQGPDLRGQLDIQRGALDRRVDRLHPLAHLVEETRELLVRCLAIAQVSLEAPGEFLLGLDRPAPVLWWFPVVSPLRGDRLVFRGERPAGGVRQLVNRRTEIRVSETAQQDVAGLQDLHRAFGALEEDDCRLRGDVFRGVGLRGGTLLGGQLGAGLHVTGLDLAGRAAVGLRSVEVSIRDGPLGRADSVLQVFCRVPRVETVVVRPHRDLLIRWGEFLDFYSVQRAYTLQQHQNRFQV